MSDDQQFNLDEALADENAPAGLRKWAESIKKLNEKLSGELAEVRTEKRQGAIAGALKQLGVSDRVAAFYPPDLSADADSIAKWINEHEGVFAPISAPDTAATPPTMSDHSPLAADVVTAMRLVQDATPVAGATTPTLADRAADIDRLKMDSRDDRAKLDSFVQEIQEIARQSQAGHVASLRR